MPTRRLFLTTPLAALAACATPEPDTTPLPPLVSGYRHLTPLRLNVLDIEVPEPAPGAVQLAEPVPLRPEAEMRRMAQERLIPTGTESQARFLVTNARFTRERFQATGGLSGMFAGEPGERLTCHLVCRLEILSGEGRRVAFVEAEVRRTQTVADGATPNARARAAETLIRQSMDELNVEFEYQIRRTLRAWLAEGATPASPAPAPVQREDLPGTTPASPLGAPRS